MIDEMSESTGRYLSSVIPSSCERIKTFNPSHHLRDSTAHLSPLPECHRGVGGQRGLRGFPLTRESDNYHPATFARQRRERTWSDGG